MSIIRFIEYTADNPSITCLTIERFEARRLRHIFLWVREMTQWNDNIIFISIYSFAVLPKSPNSSEINGQQHGAMQKFRIIPMKAFVNNCFNFVKSEYLRWIRTI